MRTYIKIKALDNLIIRENHSTQFETNVLDYIPGSTILGVFASSLYGTLSEEMANSLFQKNNAIFSNCYPLISDKDNSKLKLSFPVPLCLHKDKNKSLDKSEIYNLVSPKTSNSNDPIVQKKQIRDKYVTSDFKIHTINLSSSARTSINDKTETAADSQLYNCAYIDKGTQFLGFIDADESAMSHIKDFIKNNKDIHLGKCRTAEFGRAELSIVTPEESKQLDNVYNKVNNLSKDLFLWCLSDCEFYDLQNGINTVVPQVSNLWLNNSEGFEFDYSKSFIRTRSIRLFNRKRGGQDTEKQLIKKGSVICLKLNRDLSSDELQQLSTKGIGLDNHLGYGQVLVNPSWINDHEVTNQNAFSVVAISDTNIERKALGKKTPNLYNLLHEKSTLFKNGSDASQKAKKCFNNVVKLYTEARDFGGISKSETFGPTSAQWGDLRASLTNHLSSSKYDDSVLHIHYDSNKGEFISSGVSEFRDLIIDRLCPKSDERGWGAFGSYASLLNIHIPVLYRKEKNSKNLSIEMFNDSADKVHSNALSKNQKITIERTASTQSFAEAFIGLIFDLTLRDLINLIDLLMHNDLSNNANLSNFVKKEMK